jgi:hypothetical protein
MNDAETRPFVAFTSEAGNHYVYFRAAKRMLLCDPVVFGLAQLDPAADLSAPELREALKTTEGLEIGSLDSLDDESLLRHQRKWRLWRDTLGAVPLPQRQIISREMTPEDVEQYVASTTQVTLELTEACNMDCRYCGYGELYGDYDTRDPRRVLRRRAADGVPAHAADRRPPGAPLSARHVDLLDDHQRRPARQVRRVPRREEVRAPDQPRRQPRKQRLPGVQERKADLRHSHGQRRLVHDIQHQLRGAGLGPLRAPSF